MTATSVSRLARGLRALRALAPRVMALVALLGTAASAQLTYNRTVFLHGLNDPYRWTGQNSYGQIGQVVNLGANGAATPYSSDPAATIDNQSLSIRNSYFPNYSGKNVLVGHSLGGQVARNLLVSTDGSINVSGQIAGIVTVASPNFGAPIEAAARTWDPVTGQDIVNGFFQHLGANVLNPGGWLGALAASVVNAFINNIVTNVVKQTVAKLAGANLPGAVDLTPTGATMTRLKNTIDNLPHAAVNGSIPRGDAVYYLASGMNWGDGRSAVRNKNTVRSILRVCRTIGYNIIVHTGWGRACFLGDRALGGVDDLWWKWTHQGADQSAAFDGLLPADYTRYPGSAVNAAMNIQSTGENHFTIAFHPNGLQSVEQGMFFIGMSQIGGGSGGGCGETTCTPVTATYISHFTNADCTGTESYYTPYFSNDGVRRSWNGTGMAGTILRTVTNRSYKDSGGCHTNAWPNGNTLSGFVTIYRSVCGEASCTPVTASYISHFTNADCTGTESYYTPYFNNDGVRRSWNGTGMAGTIQRTVTNRSYKDSGGCHANAWPNGNTLSGFVTIYR